MGSFLDRAERLTLPDGQVLRILTVEELCRARQEAAALAAEGRERAVCSNACLLARGLEGAFPSGRAVLEGLSEEEIEKLADRWGEFNREVNPSPRLGAAGTEACKRLLAEDGFERLRWRVLRQFCALPTEKRVRDMTDRDYLWCALNLILDDEEELERLCPACRAEAERDRCPICGAEQADFGVNRGFDRGRFEAMKEGRL